MKTEALFVVNEGSVLHKQSLCFIKVFTLLSNYPIYVQIPI